MKTKSIEPTEKHQKFRNDLCELIKKHNLTAPEMLALSAYLTGQLIAMQDQMTMTPDMAMELVATNIEAGNKHVIDELMNSKGQS